MKQSGKDVCGNLKRCFCFSFNINCNLIQFNHNRCLVGSLRWYLSLFLAILHVDCVHLDVTGVKKKPVMLSTKYETRRSFISLNILDMFSLSSSTEVPMLCLSTHHISSDGIVLSRQMGEVSIKNVFSKVFSLRPYWLLASNSNSLILYTFKTPPPPAQNGSVRHFWCLWNPGF